MTTALLLMLALPPDPIITQMTAANAELYRRVWELQFKVRDLESQLPKFHHCMTGPHPHANVVVCWCRTIQADGFPLHSHTYVVPCARFDRDGDGDVDLLDYAIEGNRL